MRALLVSRWHREQLARAVPAALLLVACLLASLVGAQQEPSGEARWWRGNLHTHSLWSDGDDYPESIVQAYLDLGYHFLALSDHNILSEGEKWIDPAKSRGGMAAYEKYRRRFGADWVEERIVDGARRVRLKPLAEFRHLFERPNRFLLLSSEEISDRFRDRPIHVNATNIRDLIRPQGGESVLEVIQNNVNAVLEQRRRTGIPMIPHLNHPNFGWAVTAEDLMRVQGERFFEVYNGHPAVHNSGDRLRASAERIWDIVLTFRLAELGLEPLYGIAVDDAHHYHQRGPNQSNVGRGWVMVRAKHLTPESLIAAMEAGDFYASSGVRLKDVRREPNRLAVEVDAERDARYTIQFIGTRRGFDRRSEPVLDESGKALLTTRRYSSEIGTVLAEVRGTRAVYTLEGDELYVRARIVSDRPVANPTSEGGYQTAWTQPLIPSRP